MNASKWERKIRPSALDDCSPEPGEGRKEFRIDRLPCRERRGCAYDRRAPLLHFCLKIFSDDILLNRRLSKTSPLKLEIKVEGDIRFPFLRGMAIKLAVDAAEAESIMKIE